MKRSPSLVISTVYVGPMLNEEFNHVQIVINARLPKREHKPHS